MTDLAKLQAALEAGDSDAALDAMREHLNAKMTPTERIYSLGMAALTKPPRPSTQNDSASFKQVATGDLKGSWICDELTVPRREDETMSQWFDRVRTAVRDVHTLTAELNADRYELDAAAVQGKAKS